MYGLMRGYRETHSLSTSSLKSYPDTNRWAHNNIKLLHLCFIQRYVSICVCYRTWTISRKWWFLLAPRSKSWKRPRRPHGCQRGSTLWWRNWTALLPSSMLRKMSYRSVENILFPGMGPHHQSGHVLSCDQLCANSFCVIRNVKRASCVYL